MRIGWSLLAVLLSPLAVVAQMDQPTTPTAASSPPNAQMQAVLDELKALEPKPIETLDAKQARRQPTPTDAVKSLLKKQDQSTKPEEVGNVDNTSFDGPGGKNIPVRVYTPQGNGPFPVVVYYHGGGFVIADLDTYDASCRALCKQANAVVVSVDYRQAPENKFPAAVDDAFAAYQWVVSNPNKVKGNGKVAVAGESAGGNLATVVSMLAKQNNVQAPVFQLLVYPLVDNNTDTESYKEHATAKPLNKAMMMWFFQNYLDDPKSGNDPRVSPMKGDLSGLPPAMVITAQIDPLRSEGKAYADKLKSAGVEVQYKNYEGVTHEFFGMGAVVDTAKLAQADAAAALKKAFGQTGMAGSGNE